MAAYPEEAAFDRMCISHLSSFNLTAFTKLSTMIKRSVRFETRSWWDFHLVILFSTRTWLDCQFYLERLIVCFFPGCVFFLFKYRYVKTEIWIRCWLGNLGNRCPAINKDPGKRSARRYKRGRWVLTSGNRSSDQETSHVRRQSIGSVWWVHVRFNLRVAWCSLHLSPFLNLNEHTNACDLIKHAEIMTCTAESSELQSFFT